MSSPNFRLKAQKIFQGLLKKAQGISQNPKQGNALLENASFLMKQLSQDPVFCDIVAQFQAALRMVKLYFRKEYKLQSQQSLYLILAGVLYLVLPLDAIADFIPGGFLDDAVVLSFVFTRVKKELQEFQHWEQRIKQQGNRLENSVTLEGLEEK